MGELEETASKSERTEERAKKRMEKIKQGLGELTGRERHANARASQKEKRREKGAEGVREEITVDHLPTLSKDTAISTSKKHNLLPSEKIRTDQPRDADRSERQMPKDKERIQRTAREKQRPT